MECEFEMLDPGRFANVSPPDITHTRVQIVDSEPTGLRDLLTRFGEASGLPVLVNTSFNSRHEPIVCSPRDAVRVFYGTGLDMLVIGNFVLRK
jgi:carbamoyltransferase